MCSETQDCRKPCDDKIRDWMKQHGPVLLCLLLIGILLLLPTGYEDAVQYQGAERCTATVMAVDDSSIVDTGLLRTGEQRCTLQFTSGKFKGQTAVGINLLQGSLEQDKFFTVGDSALVVASVDGDIITHVTMIDHNRIPWEVVMALAFVILLVLFAGKTGLRAIGSFALTVLALWKLLVPLYLKGYSPVLVGLGITLLLTVMTIAMVYGFDRRCGAAVSGAFLGILVTCVLGMLFTDLFQIHGAVMAYSESLLYAGYQDLSLTQVFMASIFLGSSGAMIDLSVDITSAVYEVICKRPDLSAKEAVRSGLRVGRAAMGTMTTTLLLAYSGGYLGLLMVFMAQGTPISHMLNYKYVASELIQTIIGSFGLVSVAPFTALCAGFLLTRGLHAKVSRMEQQQLHRAFRP